MPVVVYEHLVPPHPGSALYFPMRQFFVAFPFLCPTWTRKCGALWRVLPTSSSTGFDPWCFSFTPLVTRDFTMDVPPGAYTVTELSEIKYWLARIVLHFVSPILSPFSWSGRHLMGCQRLIRVSQSDKLVKYLDDWGVPVPSTWDVPGECTAMLEFLYRMCLCVGFPISEHEVHPLDQHTLLPLIQSARISRAMGNTNRDFYPFDGDGCLTDPRYYDDQLGVPIPAIIHGGGFSVVGSVHLDNITWERDCVSRREGSFLVARASWKQIASGKSSEESAESSASSDSESLVGNCDSYSTDDAPLSSLSPSMAKKTPKRGAAEVLVVDDDDDAGEEEHPRKKTRKAAPPSSQAQAGSSKSAVSKAAVAPAKKKQGAAADSSTKKAPSGPRGPPGHPPGLRDPPDDVRSIVQPSPPPGKVTVVVDLKEYKRPERETMFSYKSAREVVEMYAHLAGSQTPVLHGFTPELVRHPAFFSTFPGKWLIDLGQTVEDLVQKWHECHIDRRAFRHQCPQLIPLDPLPADPLDPAYFNKDDPRPLPPTKTADPYPPFDPSKSLSMEQYDADYQAHLQLEQAHDEAQRKLVEEARAKYRADNLAWMARNKSRKEEFIADHKRKSALIEEYNEFRQHALSHLDMALNTVGIFISIVAQAEFERLSGGPSPFGSPAISVALPENPQPPKISKLKALASPAGSDSADLRWMELISPSPSVNTVARLSEEFPECTVVPLIAEMYSVRAAGRCIGQKRVEQFEAFWKEIGGAVSQYDGAKWHAENPLFNRWAPPPIPDVPVTRGYEYDRKATRFLQGFSSDFVLAKSLENRVGFDRGTLPTKCNFCRANTASCVPVPFPASFVVTDRGKAQLNEKWQAFQLNEWIEDSACTSSGGLPETLLSVIIGWIQRNSGDATAQAARARVYSANAVSPVPQGNSNAVASSSSTGDLPPFPEAALLRFAPDTHDGNPTVDGDGDVNMYGGEEQTGNGGGRKISVDYGKGKGSAVDEEDFFEEDHAGHGDEYSFDPASPIRVANPIPRPSPPPRTGSSSSLADALGRPRPRPLVNAPHSAPNPAPAPGPSGTPAPPSVYLAAPRPQSFGERARSFATGSISVGPSVPNSIYGPNFSGPPRSGGGEGSSGGAALPPWRRIGGGEETDVFGGASSRTASSSGNFGNGDQRVEHGTTGDLPSSADGPYGHPPTAHMPNDNPGTSNS
ncbi:hypothetical protein DFH06DRAFT_1352732 [Mycena polygramma]|nr:hypothetical protein DFH06DRAFT_1352732 [Mycena polygramma]